MNKTKLPFLERIFKGLKLNTVKRKLIFYSVLIIVVLAATTIYSFIYTANVATTYNGLFGSLYDFNDLSKHYYETNYRVEAVLSLSLNRSEADTQDIKNHIRQVVEETKQLDQQYRSIKSWVGIKGLIGLMETYETIAVDVLEMYESREGLLGEEYFDGAEELRKLKGYINDRLSEIMSEDIVQSSVIYSQIRDQLGQNQLIFTAVFFLILVANVITVVYFSRWFTKPIASLSKRTEKIAAGDLDISNIKVERDDELGVLAGSFNKMANNIRVLIKQITQKADVERKLKEEEMKNLKVMTELKQTELKILQSQINPHFLFNTLNTIARMAMFEEADDTLKLIESTSELLRYNLGKIKRERVTLKDEIDNVKEYIYIQQMRFSDRISFEFSIDETLLGEEAPYLVLQPIVENAIIHGIEPMETGGKLKLSVYRENENIIVKIEDNGIGMSKEELDHIYFEKSSRSIGLSNVKKRIEYFYGQQDLLTVISEKGVGTTVSVTIPKQKA
ncbi:MAG: histidine kinase [Clostridia bacterium]|jgi:two-component system, sensor histidine kinase YesM|nr:histidine kinase [Clostridia bacterium]MBT7121888.1 histidine kinase [Clostridia bacterium]